MDFGKYNIFARVAAALIFLMCPLMVLRAHDYKTAQLMYVDKYASIAVDEMYRTGVPASITLAQGILESGAGTSSLAVKSNNHFGIKCHGWKGRKVYFDDDRRGECFRAYNHYAESFRDHSNFIRYRDRYKFLFDYKTTDYKSWAKGLKKAGYATDPGYAKKLIGYIEDLGLSKYDRMSPSEAYDISSSELEREAERRVEERITEAAAAGVKLSRREIRACKKAERKALKRLMKRKKYENSGAVIPDSPLKIEAPEKFVPDETISVNLYRQIYTRNGVPYIIAMEDETAKSIADEYDLFVKEIYKFNDLERGTVLKKGDIIYLEKKKKQAAKGIDMYIVDEDGENLRDISQRFGVRLDCILKMNDLPEGYCTGEGDVVLLRK